jgi:hypothetical protein
VQQQGGADLPDFKKEEPVSRLVAVSDAGPSQQPPPLIFSDGEAERLQLEDQVRQLARAELRRMAALRGLTLPAAPAKAAKKNSAPATPAELAFTEEQFVPFDLEYNNYATVVYSARYTPAAPAAPALVASSAATPAAARSWVITVVARQAEQLQKIYSTLSDPRDLSLYPEVRLVDVVDPEGYGHFQLLFRERTREGISWLLARPGGYEMQTVFETAER